MKKQEVKILDKVLDVLNAPLLMGILSTNPTKIAKELRKRLTRRREKENFLPSTFIGNYRLNKKSLGYFCRTLEGFVNLNGLGVDWDKRQAAQLLEYVRSIERQTRRGVN